MARFSPRDPGFTRVPTLGDAIASIATSAGGGQLAGEERARRQREEDELERQRDEQREDRELRLFEEGFTRSPRTEEVPEEEDVTFGAALGLAGEETPRAPDVFEGAGIGMAPDRSAASGALDQIATQGIPPEPQVLAIPGAFVEGMGFSPRTITDFDLVEERQRSMRRPRQRLAPGVQQVTEDVFFDEQLSPEGRRAAREDEQTSEQRARLEAVLGAIQQAGGEDLPPEVIAEAMELGVPDRMLRGDQDDEEASTIRVQGRDFPDTEAGRAAAIAWRESIAEAGRTDGSGARTTRETTVRTLATAAARALDAIREDFRDMSDRERSRVPAGFIETQVRETLELFGFESVDELQNTMRELRIGEGFTPEAPGGGAAFSDADIDRLIEENPDLSPEEILQLLERGGG